MVQKTISLLAGALVSSGFSGKVTAGILWEKKFGGAGPDVATLVCATPDGGALLGGNSFSASAAGKSAALHGGGDYWVVKVDASGTKQWDVAFGGNDFERLNSMKRTADGGFILAGTSFSSTSGTKGSGAFGGGDFWVVKMSATGAQEWERTFGGTSHDAATVVRQTADGGYIVGGTSTSPVSGNKTSPAFGIDSADYWILKLDHAGGKLWERTYGGIDADELQDLEQTIDGGYIVGGHSFSGVSGNKSSAPFGNGTSDFWVLKLDAAGNKSWERADGGNDAESLTTVQQTRDGGYILGGSSYSETTGNKSSSGHGSHDYWIVKLNGAGVKQWDVSHGGADADELFSISQAPDGGFVLGGISISPVSGAKTSVNGTEFGEYWLVKTDASGAKLADQAINGGFPAQVLRAELLADSSVLVPGISTVPTADPDYSLVKIAGQVRLANSSVAGAANVFRTTISAVPGMTYVLEATTDLVNWTSVQTSQASSTTLDFNHTSGGGAKMRFYRVREQ